MDEMENISNSEILGEDIEEVTRIKLSEPYEALPAVFDFLTVPGIMNRAAPFTYLYSTINSRSHLYNDLGAPLSSSHGIYVVRHDGLHPFGVRHHFSIYTQGHFYHLSAPTLPVHLCGQRSNTFTGPGVRPQLKHEDLSSYDTQDYMKYSSSPRKKVLEAYQIGQTDFTPEQVFRLAEWITQNMPHYKIFTANCQHFALSLLKRTVVRYGNRSSFVGTVAQIVDWDLRPDGLEHVNSVGNGFLIGPPIPSKYCAWPFIDLDTKTLLFC